MYDLLKSRALLAERYEPADRRRTGSTSGTYRLEILSRNLRFGTSPPSPHPKRYIDALKAFDSKGFDFNYHYIYKRGYALENFVKWRQRPDGPWADYHQPIDKWTLRDVCESFLDDDPLKDIQPTHDIAIRVNGQYAVNNKVLLRQYRSSGKPVVLLRDLYSSGSIPLDKRITDVNFGGTHAAL